MEKKPERRALGRGLSALMADVNADMQRSVVGGQGGPDLYIPIEKIQPNPKQPRTDFDPAALEDLANSIRSKGVIQPLILRQIADDRYEIVAGERRWRASQIAQLHEVPAILRNYDDTEVLEIAIIENIQRADLNPVEEARAYRQLMESFGHTQEKLAEALGRSRSHIANTLRLLSLPDDVQDLLRLGKISAGHAKVLVAHSHASELARQVVAKGLSVREAEALSRKQVIPHNGPKPKGATAEKDADTKAIEGDLSANLGMSVRIDHGHAGDGGVVTIRYRSLEQLDVLCAILSSDPRDVAV